MLVHRLNFLPHFPFWVVRFFPHACHARIRHIFTGTQLRYSKQKVEMKQDLLVVSLVNRFKYHKLHSKRETRVLWSTVK